MATFDRRELIPVWCRLQIPHTYQLCPVLSKLASQYGLEVNITAAYLAAKGVKNGWFDLVLNGKPYQLLAALRYLQELRVKIMQLGPKLFLDAWRINCEVAPQSEAGVLNANYDLVAPSSWMSDVEQICDVEVFIPKTYRCRAMLFDLAHSHGVTVNIAAALFEPDQLEAGHFELILSGGKAQVEAKLLYLKEHGLVR
jgi:hypothetical protein